MLNVEDATEISNRMDTVLINGFIRAEKCVADLHVLTRKYWDSILAYIGSGPDPSTVDSFYRLKTREYEYQIGVLLDQAIADVASAAYRNTFAAIAWAYDNSYLRSIDLIESIPLSKRRQLPAKPVRTPTMRSRVRLKKAPTAQEIEAVTTRRGYKKRLRKWSQQVTDLEAVQRIIASGIANGLTREEIAKQIMPYVQRLDSSATRIVRNECAYAQNHFALEAMERFGDNLLGWQITNPLDDRTRSDHRRRAQEKNTDYLAGRIYWKDSKRKYNRSNRPELPDEPNCRCGWRPVLRTQKEAYKAAAESSA